MRAPGGRSSIREYLLDRNVSRGSSRSGTAAITNWSKLRRQIFETVHREIDSIIEHRLFNLFGEHSFCPYFSESDIGNLVACGLDDLDVNGVSLSAQLISNIVRLPQRQLRTTGTDAQMSHLGSCGEFQNGTSAFGLLCRRLRLSFSRRRQTGALLRRSKAVGVRSKLQSK